VNPYLPTVIEFSAMLLLWLMAMGISRTIRKIGQSTETPPSGPGSLLKFLLTPVFVLGLTWSLVLLLDHLPGPAAWLAENPKHLSAWNLFWSGLTILMLVEGTAHLLFARRGRELPIPELLLGIGRGFAVLGLAFGVLRFELGVDISPLLASTALITAVIGFALQGVLGNLLAGMSLHITRSVMPGDWIEMDSLAGKVMETNWRETRIRTMAGHVMIVPNAKLSEATVHNMVRPNPSRRHTIDVGASYSDAPDEVIAALVTAALDVESVLPNPKPDAFITAFQDYGINYQLRFWSRDYHRRITIEGDVNRMIWYRFKRAGIEIPFPMSDKLLNDYLMLVNNRMKLDPKDEEISFITEALFENDLAQKMVVDATGQPLLTKQDLQTVAPLVRKVRYTTGETLYHQGDGGHTCHVLVSGSLAGRVLDQNGGTVSDFELNPGSLVGEMSLMLDMPRSAEITVASPAVLLELGPEAFRALLGVNDQVPEAFARLANERAMVNKEAMEKWAAGRSKSDLVELNEKGFLRRFLKLLGRS
jgi:small-conductance mechanosensitive channel/CRP-like cAMP-binding protein